MERCYVERIFPDVSNDHSAFVLRFQHSSRAGKMCVIWVWLMVWLMLVSDFSVLLYSEGGGKAVLSKRR